MTVWELRDILGDFDDDTQVVIEDGYMGGYYHIDDLFVKNERVVLVEGTEVSSPKQRISNRVDRKHDRTRVEC